MYYTPTPEERILDIQREINRELPYLKKQCDSSTDKDVRLFFQKKIDHYYHLIIVYKLSNPLM